jgi:phage-related protein
MINTIVNTVIPAVAGFINSVGGKDGLTSAFKTYIDLIVNIFQPVLEGFKFAFDQIKNAVMDNKEEFTALFKFLKDFVAPLLGGVLKLAIQGIGIALGVVIDIVGKLIGGFQSLFGTIGNVIDRIQQLINMVRNNAAVRGIAGLIDSAFGGFRAAGGPVSTGKSYVVGERGPEMFVPSSNGSIVPNGGMGSTINLTVNGAIDAEGTARTIIDVLNRSSSRGTLGAGKLVLT